VLPLAAALAKGRTQKQRVSKWFHAAQSHCLLLNVVTGIESQFHYFDLRTKRQSMEWHNVTTPKE
jgi:hypothetical protein